MKLALAVLCLSVAVMVVMVFQAVRQELNLRHLKTRMLENSAEVKRKEEAIIEAKGKIQEVKTKLESVNTKMDELKKKKVETEKSTQEHDQSLQNCNSEKADIEKKKTSTTEALNKLKADHEEAKKKAEGEIQTLKQEILDRDKAICAFADTTKEEARKLCGITETPK
ncbi:tropomyosin-2 [Trachinotus anak]|uniref:tropomyosin-2 n=1 Tax=Trachinotus anak TaxID=443729 RepID=UPI0039F199E2